MENLIIKDPMSESLVYTIKNYDFSITRELTEVAIDAVMEDGILKDIPIVSVITGVAKASGKINDILFTKKLLHFLYGINDVSQEQRTKAIEKWEADADYRDKIGEILFNMIQRCDDTNKANVLSLLFKKIVLENQNSTMFLRAEKVIFALTYDDIRYFSQRKPDEVEILTYADGERFIGSGLYNTVMNNSVTNGVLDINSVMKLTEVGKVIYDALSEKKS